jgi:hypothetical protein
MHIPKRYGEYKVERCPFCKKQATTQNSDGVPVCYEHKNSELPELKCACGSFLEMKNGKFGVFFNCITCGNISKNKAYELNGLGMQRKEEDSESPENSGVSEKNEKKIDDEIKKGERREIIVDPNDPTYFD